jgi:hypothetical protein
MNTKQLNEIKKEWRKIRTDPRNSHLRKGQILYNLLPNCIANQIVGTELDPFYRNDRIVACLRHLAYLAKEQDIKEELFSKYQLELKNGKEVKEIEVEKKILPYIKKRVAKKNISSVNGEVEQGSGRVGGDL